MSLREYNETVLLVCTVTSVGLAALRFRLLGFSQSVVLQKFTIFILPSLRGYNKAALILGSAPLGFEI